MMKRALWCCGLVVLLAALYLLAINASMLSAPGPEPRSLLAHRGVHQTFDLAGVDNDTCTASRIRTPTHGFIENTAASIEAAFEAGAARVELDVRGTADGHLVVFHDHGLACRTDGHGLVRDATLDQLRGLDLGYGYTADGETYPLRGEGVGLLMTLPEALERFPNVPLYLDLKGLSDEEGRVVAGLIAQRDVWVGGHPDAVQALVEAAPHARPATRAGVKACLYRYMAVGWTGWVPSACRGQIVAVPSNYAPYLWGWPHRFTQRMASVHATPLVIGPRLDGESHSRGVDDPQTLLDLGPYQGAVLTNAIQTVSAVPGWSDGAN